MVEKFDVYEENINSIINTNALLMLLSQKNIITTEEFIVAKQKAVKDFKSEFPELFKSKERP